MFGEDVIVELTQEEEKKNEESSCTDEQERGKKKAIVKSKSKSTNISKENNAKLSSKKEKTISINIDNNDIEEEDIEIDEMLDEEEEEVPRKKKGKIKAKSQKEVSVSVKKEYSKSKKSNKKDQDQDSRISEDELYRGSSSEAEFYEEETISQQPIESGIINIQLNPSIVLNSKEEEVISNDKQSNCNKNNSIKSNNNLITMSSIMSISESENNKADKEQNDKTKYNNSNNTGMNKLKHKYQLKVNIPTPDDDNNKFAKPLSKYTNNNETHAKSNSNQCNCNSKQGYNKYMSSDTVVKGMNANRNLMETTNQSLSNGNIMSHQKMSTNDPNMFSFKPDYGYDTELLSASLNNVSYYPNITTNRSNLHNQFLFASPNVTNSNQMQMNQTINQTISTYNELIKTITPPMITQRDEKYFNMLTNYFQFPFGNDTNSNDSLNHKRYREDVMNTLTPSSQGNFRFNPGFVDNNNEYYTRKPMPSLTPTPNSHMSFDFFADNNRNVVIGNNMSNIQPNHPLSKGILSRNPNGEMNPPEYLVSPIQGGNYSNWISSINKPKEQNK